MKSANEIRRELTPEIKKRNKWKIVETAVQMLEKKYLESNGEIYYYSFHSDIVIDDRSLLDEIKRKGFKLISTKNGYFNYLISL